MTNTSDTQPSSNAAEDPIGYAEAVDELDEILDKLDDDDVDIDVLSELVGRAAYLISVCRSRISAAQQQVAGIVEALDSAGSS